MRFSSARRCALAAASLALSSSALAWTPSPDGLWQHVDTGHELSRRATWLTPGKHSAFETDFNVLRDVLLQAPMDGAQRSVSSGLEVDLPTPDGGFERFEIWEYQLLHPELAAKYPGIRTYLGRSVENATRTVRLDATYLGFNAQVLGEGGRYFVTPIFKDSLDEYVAYYTADFPKPEGVDMSCQTGAFNGLGEPLPTNDDDDPTLKAWRALRGEGSEGGTSRAPLTLANRRDYVLAVSTSGEYAASTGGTVPTTLSAITTVVNKVNAVYERDINVRMILHPNTSNTIFTNSGTDPYSNDVSSAQVNTLEAQVNTLITVAPTVDVSHLFVTGAGGGIAGGIGNICLAANSGGMSSTEGLAGGPTGDPFAIDFVAHELGHQYGGRHTFGNATACGGMDPPANQEPGSATTIMGYAGICSSENIQANSDPNFHVDSIERMVAYLGTQACQDTTVTGNTIPTANAGADFAIPISTPFTLTGTGADADLDSITYSWECRDQQAATSSALAADNGTKPLWRSFPPTTSPSRTFPRLSDVINNTSTLGEMMASLNRPSMDFTLTVRDNRANGGGVATDSMFLNVVGTAGPFTVTAPNTAANFTSNPVNVTWNVANTTAAPISTANVNILLSTNGGNTFPTVLLANTPNDGSQSITLPNGTSTTARIKVEAVGNVYWDMSNTNFSYTISGSDAISINDVAQAEGNSGTTSMTFLISLASPNPGPGNVTVDWATSNSSATAGSDYVAGSGSLTFLPTEQFKNVSVTINGDTSFEADETFNVTLSNLAGPATAGDMVGQGNIQNDDPTPPAISIADVSATEGNSGTTNLVFPVSLSFANPGPGSISANYSTGGGTASAGVDYTAASGTVVFAPSATTQNITVVVNGDADFEANETFNVSLSGITGEVVTGDLTGVGTIQNDDTPPAPTRAFAINTDTGTGATNDLEGLASFDPSNIAGSMSYSTELNIIAASNATTYFQGGDFNGSDASNFYALTYSATNGANVTLRTFNTVTRAQTANSTVTGIANHRFTGICWDPFFNSGAGRMLVLATDTTGAAAGNRGIDIRSINLSTGALTAVASATNNGTPQNGRFYGLAIPSNATATGPLYTVYVSAAGATSLYRINGTTMTLVGAMGVTSDQTINMDLKFDYLTGKLYVSNYDSANGFANNLYEVNTTTGASTNVGNLDTPVGGYATVSALGFVRPVAGQPIMSIGDVAAGPEGTGGSNTLLFPVTLDIPNPGPGNVTVNWSLGGTADTSDFNPPYSGTLTFVPTDASETISLSVVTDSQFELNESVSVSLTNATNAVILDGLGTSTLTNDDGSLPARWAYGLNTFGTDALVAFDPANMAGTFTRQETTSFTEAFQGGSFAGTDRTTFYAVQFTAPVTLVSINTATGARTNIGAVSGIPANHLFVGMAWDAAAGQMRALTAEIGALAMNASIHTINLGTGALTSSVALSGISGTVDLLGMAVPAAGGTAYAIDVDTSAGQPEGLVSINTATGVATRVGTSLGYDDADLFLQDIAMDTATGTLYRAGFEAGVHVFSSINTASGARTVIATLDTYGTPQIPALGITPANASVEDWMLVE
ncbi:MAG: Calx-beta domain-containing protein [Candidatus Sumerlaeia bacterium]|nr:Calx-beta domain-containing protein [Candidatus Sumerlaeia bacterium]